MRRLNIVTVCGCGLGSSLMAKMTIEKILDKEGVSATIDAADAGTVKGHRADIVVATREFAHAVSGVKGKVVIVTSFVNKVELAEKLSPVVKQLKVELA